MSVKPFKLNRRSFIQGLGVTCSLPFLECMAQKTPSPASAPKRLCYVYVPNGVSMPELDSKYKEWNWFPTGQDKNHQFTQVLSPLNPLKNELSILGGLSHPKSRQLLGHIAGDTWLTGGDLRNDYANSISADQLAAVSKKAEARYPSLVLSADGGVGFKSRASTLSFDVTGNAVPSEHNHRQIFARYFSPNGQGSTQERRKSLHRGQKLVDLLLDDTKRIQRRVGQQDRHKLDEHLASLNSLEEQIKRNEKWLNKPLPAFHSDHLMLDTTAEVDVKAYMRTSYDLMVLAFQIDLTRVSSYMVSREDGMGIGDQFSKLALGIKRGHHSISHDKTTGHWKEWGQYDQWLAAQFGYFVQRMKDSQDEYGSLLDNTQILYGSACSNTHNANNYPLILAGGKNMGLTHGSYTKFSNKTPMSNLLLKMLQSADVPIKNFSDSNDHMEKMNAIFNV